jgi:hypothetical protein
MHGHLPPQAQPVVTRNQVGLKQRSDPGLVVPAIPPCHACGTILELCWQGELQGAICDFCEMGVCDPRDWNESLPSSATAPNRGTSFS